jgi:signal transduction histidine kinase
LEPGFGCVRIIDSGIGIRKEDQKMIYERFWRTEEYKGHLFDGIGLGLAISKQVVEQHGGNLDVYSEEGKGSEFIVRLPLDLSE